MSVPVLEGPTPYLVLSGILFAIGLAGVAIRRNLIVMMMCIELMLNAVNILLVAYGYHFGDLNPQITVFFVMMVAAAEVAVGLTLIMLLFKLKSSVSVHDIRTLKW
ncbi:NADH-quinone oxidoreductase subunit NuoK [bacterium]|nr:NADH-quinone oxidoreductase subunit NuoK [bacterium]